MSTTGYTKEDQTLILAHIVWSDLLIDLCYDVVELEDFSLNIHRIVWEKAKEFYAEHKVKAEPTILMNKITRAVSKRDECVTFISDSELDALSTLWQDIVTIQQTGMNETYYRNVIPAYLREVRKGRVINEATASEDYETVVQELTEINETIAAWDKPPEADHDIISFEKSGLIIGDSTEAARIPTGLRLLDHALSGGTSSGELGLVFAPTGVGKTNTLLNMAVHNASLGTKSMFISLELQVNEGNNVKSRAVAMQSFINAHLVKRHIRTWPAMSANRVATVVDPSYFAHGLIQFRDHHARAINTDDVERMIISWKKAENITTLVPVYVDWQKYLNPAPSLGITAKHASWEEVVAVNEELGRIAKRQGVTIWTATQADEGCKNKPILHKGDVSFSKHIHDSVDISFGLNLSAECVLQEEDMGQELDKDMMLIGNITKNRNGQDALFELFQAPSLRFYECKEDYMKITRVLDRITEPKLIAMFINASGKATGKVHPTAAAFGGVK